MNTGSSAEAPEVGKTVWHTQPVEAIYAIFRASRDGLAPGEVERRIAEDGPNELREKRPIRPLAIFLDQFKSLVVWILLVASGIATAIGETVDALAIVGIVLLNGIIGFYQEYKAERSIAALRKMTAPRARVRRNGHGVLIPAREVVAGDILELEAGDIVAADARIIEATALRCVESALTGESEPVDKAPVLLDDPALSLGDRANMLFSGTSVAAGQAVAIVVATGMRTELGRIAGLIEEAGAAERTPLQEKLHALGRILVWVSVGIVTLLFGLGLARGAELLEMFMTAVSLAVAAVPEGLPAVVTVALALGVLRMSRRRALVRRLPSVETLGSADVICTDKTGTLTVGEMTVRELYVAGFSFEVRGEGYGPHGEVLFEGRTTGGEHAAPLLELATSLLACNNAELVLENGVWRVIGDPTEGALLAAGRKVGADRDKLERRLPRHHEIPFDSDRKRRTVIRQMPHGPLRAFVNGAPDVLLRRCTRIYAEDGVRVMTAADVEGIERRHDAMAARGLRILGSAYLDVPPGMPAAAITGDHERELVFVGLSGMQDPPRPEVKDAVARCRTAGIRVVMITGDHPRTALAIAGEIGIAAAGDSVVTGQELAAMSEEQLRDRAQRTAVYARVSSEHKLRIVRAWQALGAVVAMTGDGVNDAPALKGADIGIAMGITGTEVTKQASDMVITDDNFASIVAAVQEGRGVYDNIRLTLQYLLAGNAAELVLMIVCIVAGLPAPLLPVHLLWINLVTDGIPALCLAVDPVDPDVMRRPPRARGELITDRLFLRRVVLAGSVTAVMCLGVYLWALANGSTAFARSMAFTSLVFCELLKSFAFRDEAKPFWKLSLRSNLLLPAVVAASFGIQLLLHHVEVLSRLLQTVLPPWPDRVVLLVVALVPLVAIELSKMGGRSANGA